MCHLSVIQRSLLIVIVSMVIGVGCTQPPDATSDKKAEASKGPGPAADAKAPAVAADGVKNAAAPAETGELGEEILAVDRAPNDAPLRPLKGIPIYKLSNARIGNPGPGPSPKLMVHYERIAGEEGGIGPSVVLRTPDGNEHSTIGGFGPFEGKKKAGDYIVDLGFRAIGGRAPQNLEVYLVQNDRRWEDEGFRPKFKVSNSVVIGNMGRPLQLAREWKPDEAAKLSNPPPAAPKVNANNTVGEDTQFIGNTMGLLPPLRYADPNKHPVIGVLYRAGKGEPDKGQKIDCLVHLTPAYDSRQTRYGQEAVFAKPGYAVGALHVKTKKVVTAVQVVFMKQKPDGTLDPSDSYASKWLGHPEVGDKEATITGDGRKVIGMHLKHFGIVHAVALVLE